MVIESYNLYDYMPKRYPVKHKRKVPFEPKIVAPEGYSQRIQKIREKDLDMHRFILNAKDYLELVADAYSSNIHWSTKLEGNPLKEEEVKKITRGTLHGKLEEKPAGPAQEIINHLTNMIFPQDFRPPWHPELIRGLHGVLLKGTGIDEIGTYRDGPGGVVVDGEETAFVPAPFEHIEAEIQSLLNWLNDEGAAYDCIVTATVFFHEFESIHPFWDGNGRTGRCLFHVLLQNLGLPNAHLCKIESQLLRDQKLYYQLLAYTDDSGSYRELIDFVSGAISRGYEEAYQILSEKDLLSSDLDETAKRLLRKGKFKGDWFTVGEARGWAENVGQQTINAKLNHLVDIGAFEKMGHTRSCKYRFKSPMRDLQVLIEKDFKETTTGTGVAK